MTRRDAFDADLVSVFDDEARAPIPAGGLELLHSAIANRQPRPARLAGLGGRWISDPAGPSPVSALRAGVPVLRLSGVVLLLLLTLALIGTAALIGARLPAPEPAKLLYGLDGDIFLADADGGNPVRVAEGAALFWGSPWAPDGRHFGSYDTARGTADIRDADGHVVASGDFWGDSDWSPDSTRRQAWTDNETRISIYGIDGALQVALPLPDGYARWHETLGAWAPDGRSVWVQIARDQVFPCTGYSTGILTEADPPPCAAREAWELPIDGSAPQQLVEDLALVASGFPSLSRDGTRLAFSVPDGEDRRKLYVANADGTEARAVVRSGQTDEQGLREPIWSPSGEEIAYRDVRTDHLMVVDVATGIARALVPGWWYLDGPAHSWSRDGDRVMFWKQSGPATDDGLLPGDLWAVGVYGGEPTLLVEGATQGAWQP